MNEANTIITCICIVIFLFLAITIITMFFASKEKYSEINPSCYTGSNLCTLSTGLGGLCDQRTGRCVDIHPQDKVSGPNPIHHTHLRRHQSIHENCLHGLSVCHLDDGSSGVCGISGICFPATHLAQ